MYWFELYYGRSHQPLINMAVKGRPHCPDANVTIFKVGFNK